MCASHSLAKTLRKMQDSQMRAGNIEKTLNLATQSSYYKYPNPELSRLMENFCSWAFASTQLREPGIQTALLEVSSG